MSWGHGRDNPNYNGGLSSMKGRTICVHRDGKHWSLYSRVLMEAHLGRELAVNELVHHINGDCGDDRVENFQIVTRAEHMALHRHEYDHSASVKKAWETRRARYGPSGLKPAI